MDSKSEFGRQQEEKVARSLRARGASVQVSPGSRGPADLKITFPTGPKWLAQVKASKTDTPALPSSQELRRLKRLGTLTSATPVVVQVTPNNIEFTSARSGKRLSPPKKGRY